MPDTTAPVSVGTKRDQAAAATALAGLADITSGSELRVGSARIKFTNVDKVLYPEAGFTKLDVARYYATIAPALLAHMRGRPLTLKRYPHGVDGDFFYQKRCPEHRPDFVRTSGMIGEHDVEYCLPDDVPTLMWMSNLADLEIHVLLAKAKAVQSPTVIAFDLDPGEGAGIVECCEVALHLRHVFSDLGLEAYPKTSGSKGIQVYVPLNDPKVTYEQTKPFAKAMAELLTRQYPDLVVAKMLKALRGGKVLVDWSQNDDHKTTVCAYSLRAKSQPTVSTPITWDEVEEAHDRGDQTALRFTYADVIERVHEHGDLFAPVLTKRQVMPTLGG
ncbi:MAG: primase-like protein [Thermoleophilia bacterium]|nr:primase-like protein [Thermoleophilia bacterium]